jgi:hypothetical protein
VPQTVAGNNEGAPAEGDEENPVMDFDPSHDYVELTQTDASRLVQSMKENPSLQMDSDRCDFLINAVKGRPMRRDAIVELASTMGMESTKERFLSSPEVLIPASENLEEIMKGSLRFFPGPIGRVKAARSSLPVVNM